MPSATIWYAGKELGYSQTVWDIDEAQAIIDAHKANGRTACCTHETRRGMEMHHVYWGV